MSVCAVHGEPLTYCDCATSNGDGSGVPKLDPAALHGPMGHIARALAEQSEASLAALLGTIVVRSGVALGTAAWLPVNAAGRLPAREYLVIVGNTATARKGSAEGDVRGLWDFVSPQHRAQHGLSSGEGLIASLAAAAATEERPPAKGVLVVEEEFARTLTAAARDGSTLSAVLRTLWDDGSAAILTRNSPVRVEGLNLGVLAHITSAELDAKMRQRGGLEATNGLLNRFVWLLVRRGQVLPHGGTLTAEQVMGLGTDWGRALDAGSSVAGPVARDPETREAWAHWYQARARRDYPGVLGAMTSRAEAHTAKLSLLYALMDGSNVVRLPHHTAAVALWDYAEHSLRTLFPVQLTEHPLANRIHKWATDNDGALPWEAIQRRDHNLKRDDIDAAVALLTERGLAYVDEQPRIDQPGGRPRRYVRLVGVQS